MLEPIFDHLFATYSYTSYWLVSEFLMNSDCRLSYSPKFGVKTMKPLTHHFWLSIRLKNLKVWNKTNLSFFYLPDMRTNTKQPLGTWLTMVLIPMLGLGWLITQGLVKSDQSFWPRMLRQMKNYWLTMASWKSLLRYHKLFPLGFFSLFVPFFNKR